MIIYPSNIDLNLSKKEGRKISRKHAVPSPTAKEMLKALKAVSDIAARLDDEASYPRRRWEGEGRVIIEEKGGKGLLMRRVAKEIKRMRTPS